MSIRALLVANVVASLAAAPVAAQAEIAIDRAALSNPAQAQALYDRIEREAVRVCRREHDGMSVLGPAVRRRAIEACVVETMDSAIRSARSPELAVLHAGPEAPRLMAARE